MKNIRALSVLLLVSLVASVMLTACAPEASQPAGFLQEAPGDTQNLVGGTQVFVRDTPESRSVVLIELQNKFGQNTGLCTGVLIGKSTLLTAAHCFDSKRNPTFKKFNVVFVNDYDPRNPQVRRSSAQYMVHPDYNLQKAYDSDIAVATFFGQAPKGYQAATMDKNEVSDYTLKTATDYGFGRPRDASLGNARSGILRRGAVQLDGNYNRFLDRSWASVKSPTQVCEGDSGGPLFLTENGKTKIIGINSASMYTPDKSELPCKGFSQFTKVGHFYPWIANQLKALNAK